LGGSVVARQDALDAGRVLTFRGDTVALLSATPVLIVTHTPTACAACYAVLNDTLELVFQKVGKKVPVLLVSSKDGSVYARRALVKEMRYLFPVAESVLFHCQGCHVPEVVEKALEQTAPAVVLVASGKAEVVPYHEFFAGEQGAGARGLGRGNKPFSERLVQWLGHHLR